MNMQAMLKQAQKMQKEMMEEKSKIDQKEFIATSSIITVKATGNKKITSIKINTETIENDEIEMIEDLILVAINDVLKQIDDEIESKLGKNLQGMPGLF